MIATTEVKPRHSITPSGIGGQRDISTNLQIHNRNPCLHPVPATQSVPGYLKVPSSPTLNRTPPLPPSLSHPIITDPNPAVLPSLPSPPLLPILTPILTNPLAGRPRRYPANLSPMYSSSTSTYSHPDNLYSSSLVLGLKGHCLARAFNIGHRCEFR